MIRRFAHLFIYSIGIIIAITATVPLNGQTAPKRELRAVWVTTLSQLDYPPAPTTDSAVLRESYRYLLARFRQMGLNAVIFQVRPAADAFYPSALAPWSAYLTGKQGLPPAGNFDPLRFFVEETHRFGMEFHAWFNPYRATAGLDTAGLAPDHIFYQHRDWLFRYGNRFYFNPALPAVRNYLTTVVAEVTSRYDIDAVHLDDYFYPYKVPGEVFPDSLDYRRYGNGFSSIDDWRRSNVDTLIRQLSTAIKRQKPHVQFGISPFGVWRNRDRDPRGSPTRAGVTSYDDLYADVLLWLDRGWIDYLIPQLYWNVGFPPADHALLLDWWGQQTGGRKHLFIGHAAYKVGDNPEKAWDDPAEIPRQVLLNRKNPATSGSVFFRSQFLINNPLGITDSLHRIYSTLALPPEYEAPGASVVHPPKLKKARRKKGVVKLKWKASRRDRNQWPAYFVLYRYRKGAAQPLEDPSNIIAITPNFRQHRRYWFFDDGATAGSNYHYVLTAVNRYHQESLPSKERSIR